jgi:CDP-paratose 2-epimerase
MKILITGGAGLIGSHCAEYYAAKGGQVLVYDNLMRSTIFGAAEPSVEYNWNYLKRFKNITRVKADIRDRGRLEETFRKFKADAVIHTAGQPGVGFSLNDPCEDASINAVGTLNVVEALRQSNSKAALVYCSTNKVYGDNVNRFPIREKKTRYGFGTISGVPETCSIDHCGHTPYGVSKLAADLYVQDSAQSFGLRTGVFRMSCIYGTRQFGFEDQGWIAWFAIRFMQGRPLTIYGDGKQVRDVLWVGDLVNAFDRFISRGTPSGVFNMGGGPENTLSLLELIDLLGEITGRRVKVSFDDWRKFDQKVYISDITRVKRTLQWKPAVAPGEGVARIVRWIAENPELFDGAAR